MFGPRTILWKSFCGAGWRMTSKIIPTDLACHDQFVSFANGDLAFWILDSVVSRLSPFMEVWLGMLISPAPLTIIFFGEDDCPHISWHQKCGVISKKGQLSRVKNLNPQAGTVACSTVSCSLTRSHFVMWGWIAWWFSSGIALEKDGSYEIHWNPWRLSFTSQDPETYWWDQYDKPHNACPVLKHNHATLVYYYALLEATQI